VALFIAITLMFAAPPLTMLAVVRQTPLLAQQTALTTQRLVASSSSSTHGEEPSSPMGEAAGPQHPAENAPPAAKPTDLSLAPVTPTPTLDPWQSDQRLNVLLLGIDQRPGEDAARSNTDTMIVLTIDPASHTAGMLSLPRDLFVTLPDRTQGRINTAQALGGPAYAERAVSTLLGIPIQHYVRVNFTTVIKLVDLVGGIDVYVDQDINDPTYPDMNYGYDPFVISKGLHHMDGATALKYVRTRHQSNDFTRMQRQQQVIMAVRDRVLSSDTLLQLLPRIPTVVSTLDDSVTTDMNFTEVAQLLLLAKDIPAQSITRLTVDATAARPWTTPTGGAVLLPDSNRLHQFVQQLIEFPEATGDISQHQLPQR
jgi:LCP family protein required for cell wall assembly